MDTSPTLKTHRDMLDTAVPSPTSSTQPEVSDALDALTIGDFAITADKADEEVDKELNEESKKEPEEEPKEQAENK